MPTPLEILKQYWKHETFREPQNQIINSVLEETDTFALLPTGGGKSICFQIPALVNDGICLVISPLVALMKDQVANLQKIGIKAIALTGGISTDNMIELLDNCEFGNYKFLYLSPERLQSDWILDRIKNLPINLIAIDEAHCVSQWGHDFRPAYLKISNLKPYFPTVPFLALTASATDRVKEDIVLQLQLDKPAIFQKSFARENLAYMVFNLEDKLFRIEQILKKNPQPAIIYVRNRKSCYEISEQLNTLGIRSTFYHGGLTSKEKDKNMQSWMSEESLVIVATNAFGMGIDKPNVKTVIHVQLPENIENYYQEAGRAGRNGDKAFAILLVSPSDILQAENQFIYSLPDKKFLQEVFLKLCTHFQIAYGEGIDEIFTFNMNQFCVKYNFPAAKAYNAIQFLDRQGIITLSQEFSEKIIMQFLISSKEVIRYISLNPSDEQMLLTILRTYPGIYDMPTIINPQLIAKKSESSLAQIENLLKQLKKKGIVDFTSKKNDASIQFNEIREDAKTINRVRNILEKQNDLKISQLRSVLKYASDHVTCKSRSILEYFGETIIQDCGICSNCVSKIRRETEPKIVVKQILDTLQESDCTSREIENLTRIKSSEIISALKVLLEKEIIRLTSNNKYTLIK